MIFTMESASGTFVISLDFELYWGVRDHRTLDSYRANLEGERKAVPALLDIFEEYGVHATWATVGILFADGREAAERSTPPKKPSYENKALDPYRELASTGKSESEDPLHFAPTLIKLIRERPHQEVGTHTFSHYYCLEPGQNAATFKNDLQAALNIARSEGIQIESLVFPRNQFNQQYLLACKELGIRAYRGNQDSWLYHAKNQLDENLVRRGFRLLDSYLNLSGYHGLRVSDARKEHPYDIAASRFLRPHSPRLSLFDPLKLMRIRKELEHAATNGLIYHLWWHPHNFGVNLDENLAFLRRILDCYSRLREQHGMESCNMGELARRWAAQT